MNWTSSQIQSFLQLHFPGWHLWDCSSLRFPLWGFVLFRAQSCGFPIAHIVTKETEHPCVFNILYPEHCSVCFAFYHPAQVQLRARLDHLPEIIVDGQANTSLRWKDETTIDKAINVAAEDTVSLRVRVSHELSRVSLRGVPFVSLEIKLLSENVMAHYFCQSHGLLPPSS